MRGASCFHDGQASRMTEAAHLSMLTAVSLLLSCGAAEAPTRIPFEITGYHVFIDVEVEGEALSFAFDTGAGGVALNEATARRLGLEASGSTSVTGAAGSATVPLVGGLALRLGGLRLDGVTAALVALDHLAEVVGRPVDGIIGRDVLRGRLVLLDHDRRVLEIHEKSSLPLQDWGQPCAVRTTGPLEVQGEITLLAGESLTGVFHVDSGAGSFLILNSDFVRTHDLGDRVGFTYARRGRALTGVMTQDRVGRVAGVKFCGQEFPSRELSSARASVPVLLSGATAGVLASPGKAGLIGNAILSRFNLVFDLEHSQMYLKPNRGWDDPIRNDASGLYLVRRRDGTTLIDALVASSPATNAGLAPGDELRSIDGVDTAAMTLAELRDRLKEPEREFVLVVARDGERRVSHLHTRSLWEP